MSVSTETLKEAIKKEFGDSVRFSKGVLLVPASLEFASNPMRSRIAYGKDPDGELDAMIKEAVAQITLSMRTSEEDLSNYEFGFWSLPCEESDKLSIGLVVWAVGYKTQGL